MESTFPKYSSTSSGPKRAKSKYLMTELEEQLACFCMGIRAIRIK
jgi:hypothetical protein